jgi:mono/diheme cytochrome c family protein
LHLIVTSTAAGRFSGTDSGWMRARCAMILTKIRTIGVLFAATTAASAFAQQTGHGNPPLAIASLTGPDLFHFYCATCHGRDGKGAGPVAAALKVSPPDLTKIARRNGGVFPRERVTAFIANDGAVLSPAHGTSDMPVWGPVFRSLDPSDTKATIRITNLVAHVESLQVR